MSERIRKLLLYQKYITFCLEREMGDMIRCPRCATFHWRAELYGDEDRPRELRAPTGTDVTHQEHGTVTLPPGDYDVSRVREYDPFEDEIREVAD